MYDKCKKTAILAKFEATLLETKYIESKMFNNRSLNIKKNVQYNGRLKRTPPACPNRACFVHPGMSNNVPSSQIRVFNCEIHCPCVSDNDVIIVLFFSGNNYVLNMFSNDSSHHLINLIGMVRPLITVVSVQYLWYTPQGRRLARRALARDLIRS